MNFERQYIRRLGLVGFIQILTQFGGVSTIQQYRNLF